MQICVGDPADRLDSVGIAGGLSPGGLGSIFEGIIVFIGTVGPIVASQVVPQVFHRVEFRRIGRQWKERDVVGDLQCVAGVESCLIPDHHNVNVRRDLFGELLQEYIDDLDVDMRREHPHGMAGVWAGGAYDVQPVVSRLPNGGESLATSRPAPGQRALLAEPGFVLEVDLDSFVGVVGGDGRQPLGKVFLNASWASGSQFSWTGRGH